VWGFVGGIYRENDTMINLYLGDCMESMAKMPYKAYNLAIVDPPYGIGIGNMNMGAGTGKKCSNIKNRLWKPKDWDNLKPNEEYFNELFRISYNQIICGGNYFILPPSRCFLIWDKMIDEQLSFSQCEMIWTSFDSSAKIFRYSVYFKDEEKIHPTQKPVALYKWLLKNYAKPGDKILDTHGGSMSIAIACHYMGFDLDLWEIDPDYYYAGVKRFEQHTRQAKLFTPKEMYV
jgi:site-specific DNA-methyltransferase (adenine-specific)